MKKFKHFHFKKFKHIHFKKFKNNHFKMVKHNNFKMVNILSKVEPNSLKKIKLSNAIMILVIVSILSSLAIGSIGYLGIKKINNNVSKIYTNSVIPIKNVGEMRKNYLMFQLGVDKITQDYTKSNDYLNEIDGYRDNIRKTLKVYQESTQNANSKKVLTTFSNHFEDFLNVWEIAKPNLVNGVKLSEMESSEINRLSKIIIEELNQLVQYELTFADNINAQSNSIYRANVISFIFLFVISLFIIILVSIFVIVTLKKSLKTFLNSLEILSDGDFTEKIDGTGLNEFGLMRKALVKTVGNVSLTLKSIKDDSVEISSHSEGLSAISEEMTASSQEVANSIQRVATGSVSQAEDLQAISNLMDSFGSEFNEIAVSIEDVESNTKNINNLANISNKDLEKLINSITEINVAFSDVSQKISGLSSSINQIDGITNIINSIADQTNLLALNAAIEAARAGDAGRGFSVVADEIRKLAEQSKNSSLNISKLLLGISSETNIVVTTTNAVQNNLTNEIAVIDTSIGSFKLIVNAISDIMPKIENILNATVIINKDKDGITSRIKTSSSVAEEISSTAESIAASSEQMNASSEEVSATAQALNEMTIKMLENINKFKI